MPKAQPLIFAIGPLTGYFPLMSKTVCSFKSGYHNQYTESHAGGRTALALRFADLDALVIVGRARRLSCLSIGARHLEIKDVDFMRGMDADTCRQTAAPDVRRGIRAPLHPAHRSGRRDRLGHGRINVDSYRHFGRMGGGALMGAKNLKGIVIHGDGDFPQPAGSAYAKVFKEVYSQATSTDMMRKYYNLGTAANLQGLNDHRIPALEQSAEDLRSGHRRHNRRGLCRRDPAAQRRLFRLPGGLYPYRLYPRENAEGQPLPLPPGGL